MKIFDCVQDPIALAVQSLAKDKMTLANKKKLAEFLAVYSPEVQRAAQNYKEHEAELKAKDPEVTKEWLEYLNIELDLPKLPEDIFDKTENVTANDIFLLNRFVAQKPKLEVVETDGA